MVYVETFLKPLDDFEKFKLQNYLAELNLIDISGFLDINECINQLRFILWRQGTGKRICAENAALFCKCYDAMFSDRKIF